MLWKIMGRLYVNNKRLAKTKRGRKKHKTKQKKREAKWQSECPKTETEEDDWFDRTKQHSTIREIQLDVTDIDDISGRYTIGQSK